MGHRLHSSSEIEFFDGEGRALHSRKAEHHRPYFATLERLVGLQKLADYSFIAEHMMFDRFFVQELVASTLHGAPFSGAELATRIIGAVADEHLQYSGFSEYETYGTFVLARHPDSIVARDSRFLEKGHRTLAAVPQTTSSSSR